MQKKAEINATIHLKIKWWWHFFMITKMSSYVTEVLIEGNVIKEEERNLYLYCVEGLVETLGNLLLTIVLGIIFGKLIDTILFLLIFIPLRTLAGGYHAKSGNVCFILSIFLFLGVILTADYFQVFFESIWSAKHFVLSSLCVLLIAPVDCKNKRAGSEKKKKLRKQIFSFTSLISVVYLCMFWAGKWQYCFVISNCMLVIALLLIFGYLENMCEERYDSQVTSDHS